MQSLRVWGKQVTPEAFGSRSACRDFILYQPPPAQLALSCGQKRLSEQSLPVGWMEAAHQRAETSWLVVDLAKAAPL